MANTTLIAQPRRAKSSIALRGQAMSQEPKQKVPPLPNLSSIPPIPSPSSGVSPLSTSSTSSGLRTPPLAESRPNTIRSPRKHPPRRKLSSDITEKLNLVANELESYVEETQSGEDQENVHVAVRLKPNMSAEREVWTCDPTRSFIGGKLGDFFFGKRMLLHRLTPDYVYTGEDTNYSVYEASVKKLVKKAVNGYNATVFAYGQTSSGKTHTMRGHAEEAGIIPLAVADLFEEISSVNNP